MGSSGEASVRSKAAGLPVIQFHTRMAMSFACSWVIPTSSWPPRHVDVRWSYYSKTPRVCWFPSKTSTQPGIHQVNVKIQWRNVSSYCSNWWFSSLHEKHVGYCWCRQELNNISTVIKFAGGTKRLKYWHTPRRTHQVVLRCQVMQHKQLGSVEQDAKTKAVPY